MSGQPEFASQFEFTPNNDAVVIALAGKLDPEAVADLHPQIQEVYRAGIHRFVFDLSELQYTGSLGLRLIVGLHNQVKNDGGVALCNVNPAVAHMMEMTKLTQIFPLHPTREAALAATNK
jgi:anti-anti-sigma factor